METLKEIHIKHTRGLLDLIVLQFLNSKPMHGYQIIIEIRKTFGIYFGPSTIYPLLNSLENGGFLKSKWEINGGRPRKVYELTAMGKNLLKLTEDSLNFICRTLRKETM